MQAQQVISANKLQKKIGQTLEVLIDKVDGEDIIGRSHADAPEIDGIVFVRGDNDLLPGDLVKVKIDSAGEYDLWGAVVDN